MVQLKYFKAINTMTGKVKKEPMVDTTIVPAMLLTTFLEEYIEPTK